jgi:hypothetical protein
MRQRRFSASDFVPQGEQGHEDAVLDPNDPIHEMARLAGVRTERPVQENYCQGSNISKTASEKAALMKQHNIQPGTEEWFKLWFSLPYLTGEKPIDK